MKFLILELKDMSLAKELYKYMLVQNTNEYYCISLGATDDSVGHLLDLGKDSNVGGLQYSLKELLERYDVQAEFNTNNTKAIRQYYSINYPEELL